MSGGKNDERNKLGCNDWQIQEYDRRKFKRWCKARKEAAEHIIHALMLTFGLKEHDEAFATGVGRAYLDKRVIKIPKNFNNAYNFMVALHEIGHFVYENRIYDYEFEREYDAEMYAIRMATNYGFIFDEDIAKYTRIAKDYVRGLIFDEDENVEIKIDIKKWLNT